MRAFFAVDLPDRLAPAVAEAQAAFADAAGLTAVDPRQAHVTLKFLGEIGGGDETPAADEPADEMPADETPAADEPAPVLDDVIAAGERAVEAAEVDSFECAVRGFGVFPSLDYISVVWAGVAAGSAELTALHEALEAETTALGVDPEDHEFSPHVTLARMNDARGKGLVREAVRERRPEIGRFEVDNVRLVKSTLTSEGPEYETVASFEL
ncbi:2'-5' RNA ligase [Halorubrum saccharovorum DSM 1137]|uniref:RNA 2',3'-cyclic phosphodiesterase n=1 Tax=Halorubrum saccharovorum DSM 1137 TaxID=1227484 RepID=M0E086_9EURY|nr:RNA 2',3'-cyclic phosphodiesterase [Halorubrum saccharovorum]ELZ40448.1 2'-5' RNA ligase [Halorubrum saccharovorum DSM 1137]